MMARDSITRAGARTPGAERLDRSNGGAECPARLGIDREERVPAPIGTKGRCKPTEAKGMLGASLTGASEGKALSERPAFQPYWGKPAVRNDRGGGGNVGIIRSPVRATTSPDKSPCPDLVRAPVGQPAGATRHTIDIQCWASGLHSTGADRLNPRKGQHRCRRPDLPGLFRKEARRQP